MQVIVNKLNSNGKPLFEKDPGRQSEYAGKLKVQENRVHRLGRAVITATLTNAIDTTPRRLSSCTTRCCCGRREEDAHAWI